MENADLMQIFGVKYFEPGSKAKITAGETDLYYYETFIGGSEINLVSGDSLFWLSQDQTTAFLSRGPQLIKSPIIATLIRGYAPENRSSTITNKTNLPYINGCSTKQVFPPERPGDPTLQMLYMPPYTSEQAHHIHSTVRVVYVISGQGESIVGMGDKTVSTKLQPGMVCILEKMCPHHFRTHDSSLLVLPMHVWSTIGSQENNHPMYNGTFQL